MAPIAGSHDRRPATPEEASAEGSPSVGDDLLREILLRLPSLATLVRAACTCPAWRRALASSPAFRRRFRALHPAPLLGLFADNEYSDIDRFRLPAFAPAGDIRGGDFRLAALDAQERDEGEIEPPRQWIITECRDGFVVLVNWDAAVLAAVNPVSPRRLNYIPLPYVQHYEDIVDGRRGYAKGLRDVHWLSSDDDPMSSFRLVWLCLDESRVRAAVFSSATWDWRVLPSWVEVATTPQEKDDEWLLPGTQANGFLCWRVRKEERVLTLDTNTMEFSVCELSQQGVFDLDGWQHGSHGVIIGETKNGGELCIVRHTAFSIDVLTRQADEEGVEKWLMHHGVLNWDEDILIKNCGRQDSLAIMDGFLFLVAGDVVLSRCLETMRMTKLITTPSDHHFRFARLYPYFMAWPPSLVGNYGRFAELQDDPGNA